MPLVMFDIDGTLTRTNAVDAHCFVAALREVFQIETIETNWSAYRYVTDQGCLEEIVERHKRRPGTTDELSELSQAKQRHVELLRSSSPVKYAVKTR